LRLRKTTKSMRIVTSVTEMVRLRGALSGTVGLVPTMGYLHEGHLSLVRRAKSENRYAVVSIFVNPTQFGPSEDLAKYPRDMPRDLELLKSVDADVVFTPSPEDVYPPGYRTWVQVEEISGRLEGASRPGHFRGVATVVAKLFNIVQPARAYFGQKDAQQVVVIKKMVQDLNMNLEMIPCPTVREPDGLAMSSRNVYLNPEERKAAVVLWRSLRRAQALWEQGERTSGPIRNSMLEILNREPLAKVDYVSVAGAATLEEMEHVDGPCIVSLAVRVGKTRLIDNIMLGVS